MSACLNILNPSKLGFFLSVVAFILAAGSTVALAGPPITIEGKIVRFNSATDNPGTIEGYEFVPDTNAAGFAENGEPTVHTNYRLMIPTQLPDFAPVSPDMAVKNVQYIHNLESDLSAPRPPMPPLTANTPASLACVYHLAPQPEGQPAGCNPLFTSVNPAGGTGAIAVIDPYDHPDAAQDLAAFSAYFNLPPADFHVVYVGGPYPHITGSQPSHPSPDAGGWDGETDLDIEWSHAMAPDAKIFLIEPQTNAWSDIIPGMQAAQYIVAQNGGGEISMSIGGQEYASVESAGDAVLAGVPGNVIQLASSGDNHYGIFTNYPSASPSVISVGGTRINRDGNKSFTNETSWDAGTGGLSAYEARPSYQDSVASIVGNYRGTPDISMLGDPNTGVSIYLNGHWSIVGGTSLSSPLAAGVLNLAGSASNLFPQTTAFQTLYANGANGYNSRDVVAGVCNGGGLSAAAGYDLCTGWGSLMSYPYNSADASEFCSEGLPDSGLMTGFDVRKHCVKTTSFASGSNATPPSAGERDINGLEKSIAPVETPEAGRNKESADFAVQ